MNINKEVLKKIGLWTGSVLGIIYVLFCTVPFILNPFLNKYSTDLSKLATDATGLNVKINKIGIVTTPKLTAGVKVGELSVIMPTGEEIVELENAKVKLSLLPLLLKRIEFDIISAKDLDVNFNIYSNGKFQLEDFTSINTSDTKSDDTVNSAIVLPYGLKLSNKLPNIKVEEYKIKFVNIDDSKEYEIAGEDFSIKDFIINKKIKLSTNGEMRFLDRKQITYDVHVFNKIMPDINLNDMLTGVPAESVSQAEESETVNIIQILDGLSKLNLSANLVTDLKIKGKVDDIKLTGFINLDNFSISTGRHKLPKSYLNLLFKNKNIEIDSELYSGENEKTVFSGIFTHGKSPAADIKCKSNLNFANLIYLINHSLKAFGINDLETLSAKGVLDADFNIKADMKNVTSDGYLRVLESQPASIKYGLYNISVDNIFADVDMAGNVINLKNTGFTVAGQPLKAYGTIKNDSSVDLHLTASDILVKSLVALAGQVNLLKDNDIKNGTVSIDAALNGKLSKLIPVLEVNLKNLNIVNRPSSTTVTLPKVNLSILSNGKSLEGLIDIIGLRIVNPLAVLSLSDSKVEIDEDNINILTTYLLLNNSSLNFAGTISDYTTDRMAMNITGNGNILAHDLVKFFPENLRADMPAKGNLPISMVLVGNSKVQNLNFKLTATPENYARILDVDALKGKNTVVNSLIKVENDSIKFLETGIFADGLNKPVLELSGMVTKLSSNPKLNINLNLPNQIKFNIPGFKDSEVSAVGDILISGTPNNPILKGDVIIPNVNIPDMAFSMEGLTADINGPVLTGFGTLKKLQSGGIVAENLSADFGLKNYDIFYLKNISGDSFDGKVSGSIVYGLSTGKATVNLDGRGMDASKAIDGAAGIKNALSGNMNFDANVSLLAVDYDEMMNSLTGNVNFDISNGTFANIGRFDTFIAAQNILANKILSGAVSSVLNTDTIRKTADFDSINGEMTFKNGWANISSIKVQGPMTSYYVNGRYNLLSGTTNVVILGRLAAEVVSLLGPLGDLSVDKLTSYIPKFGMLTSSIIKAMTASPENENVALIPQLTGESQTYKDFKVEFNGGVDSASSVKSFKWLSECDTSELSPVDFKQTAEDVKTQFNDTKDAVVDATKQKIDSAKEGLNTAKDNAKESFNNAKVNVKEDFNTAKESTKETLNNAKENLKNMFKF